MMKEKEKEQKKERVVWKRPANKAEIEKMLMKNLEGFARKGAQVVNYGFWPTSHFNLDFAVSFGRLPINVDLSHLEHFNPKEPGGIPKGKITEVYGEEGGGKCLSKDTYLLTESGVITVEEMFRLHGFEASCRNHVETAKHGLVNERGAIEQTVQFTWNGRKPTKLVRSLSGADIEVTHNHPLRVISDGAVVWKRAALLKPGDFLAVMRGTNVFGNGTITPEEASLLGYLVADGSMTSESSISFSNNDEEVIEHYRNVVTTVSSRLVHSYPQHKSAGVDHNVYDTSARELLAEKYGLDYVRAAGKDVPSCVRTAGRDAQIAFLRSYFECECSIERDSSIEVISASRILLRQVQMMLLNVGIISRLGDKVVDDETYYRLLLNGSSYDLFGELIGFRTSARRKAYAERQNQNRNTNVDVVPTIAGILRSLYDSCDTDRNGHILTQSYREDNASPSYGKLREICDYFSSRVNTFNRHLLAHIEQLVACQYFYDEVVAVDDGESPTFDVVMPETHSFWSNGFISHNTSLMLRVAGVAQKRGAVVMWCDKENSFQEKLAILNGVDLDAMWMMDKAGIDAEKTFELMIDAMHAGVGLIVVDSVASLIPRWKYEHELSADTVALLARAMSKYMPSIAETAAETGCAVVFINQIRDVPGVKFGDPTTTPGGRALKFYSSLRIQVSKCYAKEAEVWKENEDGDLVLVARQALMYVRKNRFSKNLANSIPCPVYFEKFFPNAEEVAFDIGRQLQVIKVRNQIFSWKAGDDKIEGKVEGRKAFITEIVEGKHLAALIDDIKTAAPEQGVVLPPELLGFKIVSNREVKKKDVAKTDKEKAIGVYLEQEATEEVDEAQVKKEAEEAKNDADVPRTRKRKDSQLGPQNSLD